MLCVVRAIGYSVSRCRSQKVAQSLQNTRNTKEETHELYSYALVFARRVCAISVEINTRKKFQHRCWLRVTLYRLAESQLEPRAIYVTVSMTLAVRWCVYSESHCYFTDLLIHLSPDNASTTDVSFLMNSIKAGAKIT